MAEKTDKNRLDWIDEQIGALEEKQLLRRLKTRSGPQAAKIVLDGREMINFGSNDYLGLAADPRLSAAVAEAAQIEGWGGGASPLVSGRGELHRLLEQRLAELKATEAAVLFPSGYAANVGALAALVDQGDAVFSDRKNHASIIDGCRLSRAEVHLYPHADCRRLETKLDKASGYRRRLIVTDSLFSMDGDLAPLEQLADIAERFECMLMVDEAHATGVFGNHGRGVAEHLRVEHHVDVHVGTLSKALGCAGGFVAGSKSLIEWLVNRARSYVFSTAHPAAASAAALAALDIVRDEPQRSTQLLKLAADLRDTLRNQGWNVGASVSQIIPIYVGDASRVMELSTRLADVGVFVPGIRPPSVPKGESLLRVSLIYTHTPEMIQKLLQALKAVS